MANQTITVNTNFDTLTGLNADELVTVNGGATLIFNSDPQLNRIVPWTINVSDGRLLIDGTTVRELSFSSASSLPVVGDTLTAGSVAGQVIGVTGNTTAGTVRLRSLNGAIANGASLSFTGGKTATAASDDGVGWLDILFHQQRTTSVSRLSSFEVVGQWYYLGVSNGTASQTFQYYSKAQLPGLWVETGAGTNEWVQYMNLHSGFPADAGVGERGNFFRHIFNTTTITFGNGTNGNIPPNGARIRTCNVSLSSAELITAGLYTNTQNQNNRPIINTTGGGGFIADKCNFSCVYLNLTNSTLTNIKNSVAYDIRQQNAPSSTILENVIFGGSGSVEGQIIFPTIEITNGSIQATNVSAWWRSVSSGSASQQGIPLKLTDCRNSVITNCKVHLIDKKFTNDGALSIIRGDNISVTNCDLIGGRNLISASSNITLTNTGISDRHGTLAATSVNATDGFLIESSSSNIVIDGLRSINSARAWNSIVRVDSGSRNIKIRNIGSFATPYDCLSSTSGILANTAVSGSVAVQRCSVTNTRGNATELSTSMSNPSIINTSIGYSRVVETDAVNLIIKGIAGGNGVLGGSGINTGQTAANGTHFGDFFFSATTGGLVIFGNAKTTDSISAVSYELTAGTPKFNGSGSVLLRTVGDQIIWTWPWFILGHTGFQNTVFTFSGTNQANHTFEYRLDTGTGFGGAWKTLNATNLSAETISFTSGFRIQVRVTCVTTSSSNGITALLIPTTTTATAQQTLYPIGETVTLTIFSAPPGATVAIYRISDDFEIYKGFADSLGVASTTYTYEGVPVPVRVACRLAGYVAREEEAPIGSAGLSIPMRLERDLTDNLAD